MTRCYDQLVEVKVKFKNKTLGKRFQKLGKQTTLKH